MEVDDGFNLSVEVTKFSWLSQISRHNCEATLKRFYLYRTIKLIDFLQFYIYMQAKGVSKTLFIWGGGPRFSGVGFFCFVSPRA